MRVFEGVLGRLPRPWRAVADWAVTIAAAIVFVLAFEAEVAKPFRVPSGSMEPTLHCARPEASCEAHFSDRVIACEVCYRFSSPQRGQIVVFNSPKAAAEKCGTGGVYVKRLVGLPDETWQEKDGYVFIDGKKLSEPYIGPSFRDSQTLPPVKIPAGSYFMMGDNRADSCDSRMWGVVPRSGLIGPVVMTYWPPTRIVVR